MMITRSKIIMLSILFLMLMPWLGPAYGEEKGCISAKCHTDKKGYQFSHSPMPACETCHELTDKKKHKFKLGQDEKSLCGMCHPDLEKDVVFKHQPVADGNCTFCHNPHGASNKNLLKEKEISKLCWGCHDENIASRQYKHSPAASGSCTSCHKAHGAKGPKLINLAGNELCFVCHADKLDRLSKEKSVHMAARNNCTICHDPHSGSFKGSLKKQSNRICLGCHIRAVRTQDKWVALYGKGSGYDCVNCHDPHYSPNPGLLKKAQAGPCPVLK